MNSLNVCNSFINSNIVKLYHYKKDTTDVYIFLGDNYNKFKTDIDVLNKKGNKIVGDVSFEEVKNKVKAITPVPGGVGPMTICSLLMNTLKAARSEIYA